MVQVAFLRYIRQWGKKVVFVLNKVDIFERPEDVAEVTAFVEDNARDLLGVDSATVLPVSARQALDAKLDAGAGKTAAAVVPRHARLLGDLPSLLYFHTFCLAWTGFLWPKHPALHFPYSLASCGHISLCIASLLPCTDGLSTATLNSGASMFATSECA